MNWRDENHWATVREYVPHALRALCEGDAETATAAAEGIGIDRPAVRADVATLVDMVASRRSECGAEGSA